jgi:tetratricopeptide (TPR) repeat protein
MMLEPPLTPQASPLEQDRGTFVFFSYAHRDKGFRDRLEEHLSNLKYRGLITTLYDGEISAGEEWAQQIDIYLNKAHIILLLISASFMASEYCYSIEMRRALERHERQEAHVIPILLRPVLFTDAPFAKLQMLPTNGKPVIQWRDRDSAFVDIAYAIERVAQKYLPSEQTIPSLPTEQAPYIDEQATPIPSGRHAKSLVPPPPPMAAQPSRARGRRLSLLLLGVVVLFACILLSSLLFYFFDFTLGAHLSTSATPSATSIASPTPSATSIASPTPTPNFSYTPTPIIILGLLLLVSVIAALIAIWVIRRKIGQRRAQGAFEEARKRGYYEEAIEAYRRALSLNPLDADALRGMGNGTLRTRILRSSARRF